MAVGAVVRVVTFEFKKLASTLLLLPVLALAVSTLAATLPLKDESAFKAASCQRLIRLSATVATATSGQPLQYMQ